MQISEFLDKDGLLSKIIPGFTPRESQKQMAEAITKAIELETSLVIEAGTGTGKTFSYLIPIFLSQKKTIISTGTKNLQDQLFFKDIPVIKQLFSFPRKIVLLKGRANYLCLYRLENNLQDGRFISRREVTQLHQIHEWSSLTTTGDIAELTDIPEESSTIWYHVTSTIDNCLNQDCEFYKKCFVVKARHEAKDADIVIVNHHLFFADLRLQETGFGELLPSADIVVFDEAHHLRELASIFFSSRISSRQLLELARDSEVEYSKMAKDMQTLRDASVDLQNAVREMRDHFGFDSKRSAWPETPIMKISESINAVKESLRILENHLKLAAERSKGLENCWRRTTQLISSFAVHTEEQHKDTVHWFETFSNGFSIHLTPMNVANQFKMHLAERKRTWIFTSATLTIQNSFHLFVESLGLEQSMQLQLGSPFDYKKQCLLYAPRGLPNPNASNYVEQMVDRIIPVLTITQGRAFILFTSYKALEEASALLKLQIPYPILVQGELSKRQLIEQFKQLGNAVLCGTSSFWYGVDVRGDSLSCVIIDKLPFSTPDEPVLKARIQMLRKQGLDPFIQYQLPNAVLILKQGAGRLIRDIEDRGILMICDPRMVGSRYGETFIRSLPPMSRTRDLKKVNEFFNNL